MNCMWLAVLVLLALPLLQLMHVILFLEVMSRYMVMTTSSQRKVSSVKVHFVINKAVHLMIHDMPKGGQGLHELPK